MPRPQTGRPNPIVERVFTVMLVSLLVLAGCSDSDDGDGNDPTEPDTTPPPAVTNLRAIPGDGQVTLSWSNPTGGDWAGTMVRRDTAPPDGPESGELVTDTTGESFIDAAVTNDVTYVYAAYSYDLAGNHSGPVQATATPHEPVVVTFPDANLEQAMRNLTGVGSGDITDLDLLPLTELDLASNQITDLTGLQWCANVTALVLANNDLTDDSNLDVLAAMTALTELELGEADLTTLAPLADLTGLTRLEFSCPQVSDLAPLASLTGLTSLRFGDLAITSLAPLTGLSSLEVLQFYRCEGIASFDALASLTSLVRLQAEDVRTADLSPLATLIDVEVLTINGCLAHEISAVMTMPQLQSLSLYRMPLLREAIDVQIPALEAEGVYVGWSSMIAEETVGTWTMSGVTVDGSAVDPAEFFEWDAGTEAAVLFAYANTDYAYEERDAADETLYRETGYIITDDTQLRVVVETENGEEVQDYNAFLGTWAVTGDDLVLTTEQDGSTIVLTWTR